MAGLAAGSLVRLIGQRFPRGARCRRISPRWFVAARRGVPPPALSRRGYSYPGPREDMRRHRLSHHHGQKSICACTGNTGIQENREKIPSWLAFSPV